MYYRSVRVEQGSVNSVILNDQPQDTHQRFLVAANIGINTTGSTVVARYIFYSSKIN